MNLPEFIEKRLGAFKIQEGSKTGWRVRAKLAVRGKTGAPLIGLFKEGSHEVYELLDCPDHHPKINEAAHLVKDWMVRYQVAPYKEKEHEGVLKYVQFVVERESSQVQVSFVIINEEGFYPLLEKLKNDSPIGFWHSLWVNVHPKPANTIFSSDWRLVHGKQWLEETICSVHACFLPGSFGQANLEMFEKMIKDILLKMQSYKEILELYAGIGVIGLALSEKASALTLCESNPESKKCFDQMMKIQPNDKTHYLLQPSQEAIQRIKNADLLIADPPRKGLDKELIEALLKPSELKEFIYISCGADSFMRDAVLLENGGWRLVSAEGYLFFPRTSHIETLAFFKK